jgi:hypothetical protein
MRRALALSAMLAVLGVALGAAAIDQRPAGAAIRVPITEFQTATVGPLTVRFPVGPIPAGQMFPIYISGGTPFDTVASGGTYLGTPSIRLDSTGSGTLMNSGFLEFVPGNGIDGMVQARFFLAAFSVGRGFVAVPGTIPIYEPARVRVPPVVYRGEPFEVTIEDGRPGFQGTINQIPYTIDSNGFARVTVVANTNRLLTILPSSVENLEYSTLIDINLVDRPVTTTTTAITTPTTVTPTTIATTTIAPTTIAPTTVAPTTLPPVQVLAIDAPRQVMLGESFTVNISGMRADGVAAVTADTTEMGWVRSNGGTGSITTALWQEGPTTITVTQRRWANNQFVFDAPVSVPIVVVRPTATPVVPRESVSAPTTITIGVPFTVTASQLEPGMFMEVLIDGNTLGWRVVEPTGVASLTTTYWIAGTSTLTIRLHRNGRLFASTLSSVTVQ